MAEVRCPWRPLHGVTPVEVVTDVVRAHTPPAVNARAARAGWTRIRTGLRGSHPRVRSTGPWARLGGRWV